MSTKICSVGPLVYKPQVPGVCKSMVTVYSASSSVLIARLYLAPINGHENVAIFLCTSRRLTHGTPAPAQNSGYHT